ncbi:MAG: choice-of-anchor D domain-containing protein [Acidobacteria bacterium]|nr:choice-of-anchor D domain-containing protein [Acidobacteriota bacterium]
MTTALILAMLTAARCGIAQDQSAIHLTSRDSRAALIAPGAEAAILEFIADPAPGGGDVFHVVVSAQGATISLLTPAGIEITAQNAGTLGYSYSSFEGLPSNAIIPGPLSMPGFHTFIGLPPASPEGLYRVKATPANVIAQAAVVATYTSSSAVRAGVATGKGIYRLDEPVALTGVFFDGAAPLAAVRAIVRIRAQDDEAATATDLTLEDSHDLDGQAGDGNYFALWRPPGPGRFLAAMKATGVSRSGIAFSRLASAEFRVLAPLAVIESIYDSAVDDNGDGLADRIVLGANLDVATAGEYLLLLKVGSEQLAVPARRAAVLEKGKSRIEVNLALETLASLAPAGPYSITNVMLVHQDEPEPPVVDERSDAGKTAAYPVAELLRAATAPLLASPTSLAFGDVEIGASRELEIVLRNRMPFSFTETVMRMPAGPFTIVTPSAPFTVPASGQLALGVRFRPAATGTQSVTFAVAGINIAISGNGVAARPAAEVSPTRLDFGRVAVTQARELSLTVRNPGSTPLPIDNITITNARFSIVSPPTPPPPFTVGSGLVQVVTVRFSPIAPGEQSGVMRIAGVDVTLAGIGESPPAAPSIAVTPSSLDFGTVTIGQTRELTVSVRNAGGAALSIRSIASSNARFTVVRPTAFPLSVSPGLIESVVVRFTPTTAAAVTGTLTLTSNDAARAAVSVDLRGTGVASTATPTLLQVDDGTFELVAGFPLSPGTGYFVNRLTPTRYPATLRSVLIFIDGAELPAGTQLTVLRASSQGGSMTGLAFTSTAFRVASVDGFSDVPVTPVTIQSGDFVVGFSIANRQNVFPAVLDVSPPSRQRSYTSADGVTFQLIDTNPALRPGNLGIRARVD